ncbi:DUF1810 domain-containing protein [Flavobacterium agrisoli]|uniref:DUF1810 domain-containing protein n=1 Tax=Flavobacterium agrisoli TaxID=2793066 RepID=A0A934UJF8_9FLAO|nr:DUF1810 domain-containing protein [Flavobacterium agrisoli]MBK0369842.1 DUF1810 domain-containing protein [Flavobacterium agrisoli]
MQHNLNRFLQAQTNTYATALEEIQNGQKQSHWMWFIFPQIAGLGFTDYNIFYAIKNIKDAQAYYNHPILGKRLIEISEAILQVQNKTALEILGKPDSRKLKSCMTLFLQLPNAAPIFQKVLDKYYNAAQDEKTIEILKT